MHDSDSDIVEAAYDDLLLTCFDLLEREDFFGIATRESVGTFAQQLALGPESHVLDIGSGIGGPARYLAARFGCQVTGVDLSAFNHRTAVQRSADAGFDRLRFLHGDALRVPLADASFTPVFGCETLCFFPTNHSSTTSPCAF